MKIFSHIYLTSRTRFRSSGATSSFLLAVLVGSIPEPAIAQTAAQDGGVTKPKGTCQCKGMPKTNPVPNMTAAQANALFPTKWFGESVSFARVHVDASSLCQVTQMIRRWCSLVATPTR